MNIIYCLYKILLKKFFRLDMVNILNLYKFKIWIYQAGLMFGNDLKKCDYIFKLDKEKL